MCALCVCLNMCWMRYRSVLVEFGNSRKPSGITIFLWIDPNYFMSWFHERNCNSEYFNLAVSPTYIPPIYGNQTRIIQIKTFETINLYRIVPIFHQISLWKTYFGENGSLVLMLFLENEIDSTGSSSKCSMKHGKTQILIYEFVAPSALNYNYLVRTAVVEIGVQTLLWLIISRNYKWYHTKRGTFYRCLILSFHYILTARRWCAHIFVNSSRTKTKYQENWM